MHANKPGMAKRWEAETPSGDSLPEHVTGKIKKAEPGPPKGVSLEEWDRVLQRGAAKTADFPNAAGPEDWDAVGDSPWKQGEPKDSKDKLDEKKEKGSQYFDGDPVKELMPYMRGIHKIGHIKQAMHPALGIPLRIGGGAAIGAGIGALTGKEGDRARRAKKGAIIGAAIPTGAIIGGTLGSLAGYGASKRLKATEGALREYAGPELSAAHPHVESLLDTLRTRALTHPDLHEAGALAREVTQHSRQLNAAELELLQHSAMGALPGIAVGGIGGGLLGASIAHKVVPPKKEKRASMMSDIGDMGTGGDMGGHVTFQMPGKLKRSAGLDQEYPQVEDGEKGYDAPVTHQEARQGPWKRSKVAYVVHLPERSYRAFLDELGHLPELTDAHMEKEAVDPLTLGLLGTASHVGANLAVKAGHGTRFLKNVRATRMSEGIRRALEGKAQGLGSRMAETWVGPELIAPEHVGRRIGGQLRELTTGQRYRALKKLRKSVAMSPDLQKAPILEDMVGGVNRALASPLPAPGAIQKPSFLQRVLPNASIPAVGMVAPESVVHAGINKIRKAVATSGTGRQFLKDQAVEGAIHGAPSKAHQVLMDTFVSPSALATRRVGEAATTAMANDPQQVKRLAGAVHNLAGQRKVLEKVHDAPAAVHKLIGGHVPPAPTAAPVPQISHSAAPTGALMPFRV
jgi:hypothetical protein